VPSVFLQFDLPSPFVWCLAAFALAIGIFFQFLRPFTLRNWDLLGLFAFGPGFLLLEEARRHQNEATRYVGYSWLLAVTGLWFVRCLLDSRVVRRVRVAPNCTRPALYWLGGTLLVGLSIGLMVRPAESPTLGKPPVLLRGVEDTATTVVKHVQPEETDSSQVVRHWVSRSLALLCHIAVVMLLVMICWKIFHDATAAAASSILYLLLPATGFAYEQSHHVWPTAFVLAAVLSYRKANFAGVFLGIAAGTSFFPLLLFPAWMQFYRGRGQGHFAFWFGITAGCSMLVAVLSLSLAGTVTSGLWQSFHLADWQPWTVPTAESIWTGGRWIYRLPLFVVYVGFVLFTFIWPSVRNLAQLLAMNAAVLIGIQFWFADRGGVYVLWYAPLLILMMLRPTATELVPPSVEGKRLFGWLKRKSTNDALAPPTLAV
jgi:hypothetical protein